MSFSLSWTMPYDGEIKTLKLTRDPLHYGLGIYVDVDGERWDIKMIVGGEEQYVCARQIKQHPVYYGTANWCHCGGYHEWHPYKIQIVEEKAC